MKSKKNKLFLGSILLLMLIGTYAGCAATRTSESTGEYIDDSSITAKVKTQLAEDDVLKAFKINVETYKGVVQLSGFVDSLQTKERAGQTAAAVKGVRSVKNSLAVK
jgi:osmotically-inducible protein OsmY